MPTLREAKQAAEQGHLQQARLMYEAVLQESPHLEDAWLGLARILTDDEQRQECYQKVLRINPKNLTAKSAMKRLESRVPEWVKVVRGKEFAAPVIEDDYELQPISKKTKSKKSRSKSSKKKPPKTVLYGAIVFLLLVFIISIAVVIYLVVLHR
jgi:tetratricopeptide (TPR) repeat protein